MLMPKRSYSAAGSYRYGFNGKENDNDVKGLGNQQDYGMRIYDARVGRFLSVDPLSKSYPWYTPYQFAGNTPIQAIDLDGLEELKSIYFNNVRFVVLKNVTFDFVIRKSTNTLTTEMIGKDATERTEYSVNLQMYEPKPGTNPDYYTAIKPQANYRSQGLNNASGKTVEGRSSPSTFFFSIGNNGAVTTGMGDAPMDSKISFGGGVPLYVNGLKYGESNIWKEGTPAEISKNTKGAVAPENTKYLIQKSNSAYPAQNETDQGKTILAYNSKQNIWLVASQEDGTNGMTLDRIRDKLVNEGWDQILSFDGSSSATLVKDKQVLTKPANYKNNTAPSGLSLSVPNK
jgi:RHS repeat-associated protein